MSHEADVREAFPEIDLIDDAEFRQRVVNVWVAGIESSEFDAIDNVPWWPPFADILGTGDIQNIKHIRDVVQLAIGQMDALDERFDLGIDRDVVVAGALLHDVSKLYELTADSTTALQKYLPHPHYAVHLLADHGLSLHLQHIALTHSTGSAVEPKTMEAKIIQRADQVALDALFWEYNGELATE